MKKVLLAVMLLMSVSVSAEVIIGHWIYDRVVSVSQAKSEDKKWFLKDTKAKDAIFYKNGNYGRVTPSLLL